MSRKKKSCYRKNYETIILDILKEKPMKGSDLLKIVGGSVNNYYKSLKKLVEYGKIRKEIGYRNSTIYHIVECINNEDYFIELYGNNSTLHHVYQYLIVDALNNN